LNLFDLSSYRRRDFIDFWRGLRNSTFAAILNSLLARFALPVGLSVLGALAHGTSHFPSSDSRGLKLMESASHTTKQSARVHRQAALLLPRGFTFRAWTAAVERRLDQDTAPFINPGLGVAQSAEAVKVPRAQYIVAEA
jgi:hypothetical protein